MPLCLLFFNKLLLLCFGVNQYNVFIIKIYNKDGHNGYASINIKKRRATKGLRHQDVADKLCMSLRRYQNLESGDIKLDIERLEKIAQTLEANIEGVV